MRFRERADNKSRERSVETNRGSKERERILLSKKNSKLDVFHVNLVLNIGSVNHHIELAGARERERESFDI